MRLSKRSASSDKGGRAHIEKITSNACDVTLYATGRTHRSRRLHTFECRLDPQLQLSRHPWPGCGDEGGLMSKPSTLSAPTQRRKRLAATERDIKPLIYIRERAREWRHFHLRFIEGVNDSSSVDHRRFVLYPERLNYCLRSRELEPNTGDIFWQVLIERKLLTQNVRK